MKFRAWDKQNKCWFSPVESNLWLNICIPSGELICGDTGSDEGQDADFTFEISQFTGLKDKNGKEIYVGDIVKNGYSGLFLIESCAGGFQCKYLDNLGIWQIAVLNSQCEIVGNKWENPNLLDRPSSQ